MPVRKNTHIRVYYDHPLEAGRHVMLEGDKFHYLCRVMRLGEGDGALFFNGKDGEWRGELSAPGKRGVSVRLVEKTREREELNGLTLIFSPIKSKAQNFLIQKATELGVSIFRPTFFDRTVARDIFAEHGSRVAEEAAEQCERVNVPFFAEHFDFENSLRKCNLEGAVVMLCDETGAGRPAGQALADLPAHKHPAIVIGPEGGITDGERQLAQDMLGDKLVRISLGPRILKAETAAIAALTCYQSYCGDWNGVPRYRG